MKSEGRIEEMIWGNLINNIRGGKGTILKFPGRNIYSKQLSRRILKHFGRRI